MKMKLNIIGLNIEKYIQEYYVGHNTDFEKETRQADKFHLFFKDNDKKYEILLYENYDICVSGWTTASYGMMKFREIEELPSIEYFVDDEYDREIEYYPLNNGKKYQDVIQMKDGVSIIIGFNFHTMVVIATIRVVTSQLFINFHRKKLGNFSFLLKSLID